MKWPCIIANRLEQSYRGLPVYASYQISKLYSLWFQAISIFILFPILSSSAMWFKRSCLIETIVNDRWRTMVWGVGVTTAHDELYTSELKHVSYHLRKSVSLFHLVAPLVCVLIHSKPEKQIARLHLIVNENCIYTVKINTVKLYSSINNMRTQNNLKYWNISSFTFFTFLILANLRTSITQDLKLCMCFFK